MPLLGLTVGRRVIFGDKLERLTPAPPAPLSIACVAGHAAVTPALIVSLLSIDCLLIFH